MDNLSGFKSAPICPKSAHNFFPKKRPNFSQNEQFLEDISEEMTTKNFYSILIIIAWNSWVFCLLIITIFLKKPFSMLIWNFKKSAPRKFCGTLGPQKRTDGALAHTIGHTDNLINLVSSHNKLLRIFWGNILFSLVKKY